VMMMVPPQAVEVAKIHQTQIGLEIRI